MPSQTSPTHQASSARDVERWLSAKPSRGFGLPVIVFMKREFLRMSEPHVSYDIEIHRGRPFMPESSSPLARVAKILRLPRLFSKMAAELGCAQNATVPLGVITYKIDGKCAITDDVFPMSMSENSRRFGTYLELACTHNLEKTNTAETVLTPADTRKFRRAQMKDCGLKINAETPIMVWKRGLSLRLHKHSQAARAGRAAQKQAPIR